MGVCPRTTYCHVGRRCERRRGTENRPDDHVHPAEIRDVISQLDDRLPNQGENSSRYHLRRNCPPTLTGDNCEESATKPSLSKGAYQRKHQATIEARLEKLEEYCM
ncbi:hypothetical protein T07_11143 [Trichinella nelsoni]|uniref:Uncharacterized protein n=1 Tax=Trichinella nelsoni TaxID=6336 RepID=A0A0V0RE68_9BILA|nr:hypothetical protein T07_11143 [Trichinella nelsoni]